MAKNPANLRGGQQFRIGVGALIVRDSKILLGLRGPKARDQHNKWELFGGLVELACEIRPSV